MSELDSVYEDFESDVGIDSDEDRKNGQANRQEWFKGDKNRTYRVALVYFHTVDVVTATTALSQAKKEGVKLSKDDLEKLAKDALAKRAQSLSKAVDALTPIEKLDTTQVKFKKMSAYYKDGLGYVLSRLGKDGAEADNVWKSLGEEKKYFTTVVLFYPADKDGNLARTPAGELDKARLMTDWYVLPWRFSPKTYDSIWTVNKGLRSNELTIADQDLILKCENAEFQNFKVTAGGKATWRKSPELQRRILEKASTFYDKLVPFRELSTADLRIKLGLSSGNVAEEVSADFDGLLENV